jgi:hypothetical protein
MDQILVMNTIIEGETAVAKALEEANRGDDGAAHNWDEAFAYYVGTNMGCSPYARANKRASNYGTKLADGVTAAANKKAIDALNAGLVHLRADTYNGAAAQTELDNLKAAVYVTYYQATLRYAAKIDKDIRDDLPTAEHQAEGAAFWRVIAPQINACNAAGSDEIAELYDLSSPPTHGCYYCHTLDTLTGCLEGAGITTAEFGSLEDADPTRGGIEWDCSCMDDDSHDHDSHDGHDHGTTDAVTTISPASFVKPYLAFAALVAAGFLQML